VLAREGCELHPIELRNTLLARSLRRSHSGGHAAILYRSGMAVLPESKNMCKRSIGVPQELGRSCRLLGRIPAGDTGLPTPGPSRPHLVRGEQNHKCNRGIAKRRQRSAARRAAGSRNALIVPLKQGNSPWRTLWRGSEASSVRLNRGKHAEHIEVP